MYDVLVSGGGASGLASGLSAARAGAGRVAVVERQARVGKKLLATGNGRCNLYHYGLRAEEYAGDRAFIRAVLGGFDADAFFAGGSPPAKSEQPAESNLYNKRTDDALTTEREVQRKGRQSIALLL